jgi:hypothetical protein
MMRNPTVVKELTNSDKEKAEVLNEYFANVGERLAQNLLQGNQLNVYTVNKVTPTVANIEITQELVCQEISKLNQTKQQALITLVRNC